MTKFYLSQQEKDEPPRKPSTVFRVRVRALFEWQNCPKVVRVRGGRVGRVRVRALYKQTLMRHNGEVIIEIGCIESVSSKTKYRIMK